MSPDHTALTPQSLNAAIKTAKAQPKPSVLVRRIEELAKWCKGDTATPALFAYDLEPLNVLITLVIYDQTQWAKAKEKILAKAEKATWKEHQAVDRKEYMRQYMARYRAQKADLDQK